MTTSIYTLSLHDALPIFQTIAMTLDGFPHGGGMRGQKEPRHMNEIRRQAELRSHPLPAGELTIRASSSEARSEEHTSELQSLAYLVCRLLLEKKKIASIQ